MHSPYPGVRLPVGFEMTIEPDEIAVGLVRRGFFDEIKPNLSEIIVVKNAEAEESPLSEPKKMKKHRGAD